MHYCHVCGERIENKEAYIGTKEEKLIYSCFHCYINTLKPIKFDDEKIRYPLVGTRDIQLHDSIVFYNVAGKELARIFLKTYNEGMIDFIKSELQRDVGIREDDLIIIIEPYDVKLKV